MARWGRSFPVPHRLGQVALLVGTAVAIQAVPTVAEAIPVAPGPDFFWIGGRWQWNGRWVWVNGHFDRHPHYHPGAYWENGHWDDPGGCKTYRTQAMEEDAIRRLMRMYPGMIRRVDRGGTGFSIQLDF